MWPGCAGCSASGAAAGRPGRHAPRSRCGPRPAGPARRRGWPASRAGCPGRGGGVAVEHLGGGEQQIRRPRPQRLPGQRQVAVQGQAAGDAAQAVRAPGTVGLRPDQVPAARRAGQVRADEVLALSAPGLSRARVAQAPILARWRAYRRTGRRCGSAACPAFSRTPATARAVATASRNWSRRSSLRGYRARVCTWNRPGTARRGHRGEGGQVKGQRLPAAGARADDHSAAVLPRSATQRSTAPRPAGTWPGPGRRSGRRPRRAAAVPSRASAEVRSRLSRLEMSRLG